MKKVTPVENLLTVKRFVDWLKKQPPRRRYRYMDNTNCILCQYLKAHGHTGVHAGGDTISTATDRFDLPTEIANAVVPRGSTAAFGTVLSRLTTKAAH